MPDIIDRAQELDTRFREAATRAATSRAHQFAGTTPSAAHCQDCGEAIPEARRKAVPGVRFCTFCTEDRARKESRK